MLFRASAKLALALSVAARRDATKLRREAARVRFGAQRVARPETCLARSNIQPASQPAGGSQARARNMESETGRLARSQQKSSLFVGASHERAAAAAAESRALFQVRRAPSRRDLPLAPAESAHLERASVCLFQLENTLVSQLVLSRRAPKCLLGALKCNTTAHD